MDFSSIVLWYKNIFQALSSMQCLYTLSFTMKASFPTKLFIPLQTPSINWILNENVLHLGIKLSSYDLLSINEFIVSGLYLALARKTK